MWGPFFPWREGAVPHLHGGFEPPFDVEQDPALARCGELPLLGVDHGERSRTTPVLTTHIEDPTGAPGKRPRGIYEPEPKTLNELAPGHSLLRCCFPSDLAEISTRAHLLVEQLGDGHSGVALRAQPSSPYAPHKSAAFLAVLRANCPLPATVALINGVGPAGPGGWQFCNSLPGVPAPAVSSSPARPRAEFLAARRDEGTLAHGAGHRDAIVTQRGPTVDLCAGAAR